MLKKQMLSFDIGTYLTKVVIGKGNTNKVVLKEVFSFPTPVGAVEDGQIVNMLPLKEEILKNLDERNIFTENAVFSIASTKVIMRELILPYVNEKKTEAMVLYELPKHLPVNVDNYVTKHLTIEVFKDENTKKARVLIMAVPKQIVKKYWDLCTDLEIKPHALTLHGIGSAGFFQQKLATGQLETVALIDLGHASINCNIISGGKLIFNRIISTAGMKNRPEIHNDIDKSLSPANYEKTAKDMMDKWLEEIKLVFRFYFSSESNRSDINRIVLMGGLAGIPDIAPYFEKSLEKPTSVLREHERIIYKGDNADFRLNQYFNAISALTLN